MMDDLSASANIGQPDMQKRKGISPIWILPIVALLIAGWLVYKSIVDAGIKVVMTFATAQGIEKGKTRVMFRGMPIGLVQGLTINKDFNGVDVQVEFVKSAQSLLTQGAKFWMVEPRISAQGITGLETILRGNYIALKPGKGEEAFQFTALSEPPPMTSTEPGLQIQLTAGNLGSLDTGSMVYFKGIEVGKIQRCALGKDNNVAIDVFIQKEYAHLLKKKSRFYSVSGITLEGGLSGFKIRTEALSALVKGGIAFFTSGDGKGLKDAQNGDVFRLFENRDAALQEGSGITPEKIESKEGLQITLETERAGSLKPGDPVYFRQIKVGKVTQCRLSPDAVSALVDLDIERYYAPLVRTDSKFWKASGINMSFGFFSGAQVKTESLEAMLAGGVAFATPEKQPVKVESKHKEKGVELNEYGLEKKIPAKKSAKPSSPSGRVVKKGARFILHDKPEDTWLIWRPVIVLAE